MGVLSNADTTCIMVPKLFIAKQCYQDSEKTSENAYLSDLNVILHCLCSADDIIMGENL